MNRVATLHTRRRSLRRQRRGVGITVVTALIALVFFFPVLIAVLNSFKDKGEIIASALTLPQAPTLENYRTVLEASDFPTAFLNSCLVTGGGIVLNLIVSTLAGYALARWNSVWADVLTLLFLSSMFVPFHTIMISLLTTAKGMHLTGHIYGLILIYCGLQCPIPIFLIKGFVDGVTETPAKLPADSVGNQVSLDTAKAGVQAWFDRKAGPFSVQRTPQSTPQPACVEPPQETDPSRDNRVRVFATDTRLEHLRF